MEITEHTFMHPTGKTRYIEAGRKDAPLLIFIHGWIAVAETWLPQLSYFLSLGFRVVAPDTRGYGGSVSSSNSTFTVRDYALEVHVADMLALLEQLGTEKAVWIGHDWGAGIVWALAAHHPESCVGVAGLTVPYRTLEFGRDRLVSLVNRDLYPIEKYPLGQWDYQAFHQEQPDRSASTLEKDPENTIKFLWPKSSPQGYGKPAFTAKVREIGGFFGPADSAPETDVNNTLLKDHPEILSKLVETVRKNGTRGPNAYYLNNDANKTYAENSVNGGKLKFPVLFIGAKWDLVCEPRNSRFAEPMREACDDLLEVEIEAGHWVAFEKPEETNEVIEGWLKKKLPEYWPKA